MATKCITGKLYQGVYSKDIYECLFVKHDCAFLWNRISKKGVADNGNLSLTEYIEPKKVYCSVWKSPTSSYSWPLALMNKSDYDKMCQTYKNWNYILIKEWELEY